MPEPFYYCYVFVFWKIYFSIHENMRIFITGNLSRVVATWVVILFATPDRTFPGVSLKTTYSKPPDPLDSPRTLTRDSLDTCGRYPKTYQKPRGDPAESLWLTKDPRDNWKTHWRLPGNPIESTWRPIRDSSETYRTLTQDPPKTYRR